ncbi:peptidoglycan-binding domain-containing protein [Roseovarius sp.]|uniref:peptidoglycan-binding domain-containing protein n=1 Tax=Roseovarius sp. TaxID=1486281 RepID=UPI003563E75C
MGNREARDFGSFCSTLASMFCPKPRGSFRRASVPLCLWLLIGHASPAGAQDSAEALLAEASALYDGAETAPETLVSIREMLDHIVSEHPASDIAVQILLRQTVGDLDIAAIEAEAGEVGTASVSSVAAGAQGCLADAITGRVEAPVTLTATVTNNGRIAGLPNLHAPASVDDAARRTFLSAATAIDACAPFEEAFRGREIEVAFTPEGAVELDTANEPSGERSAQDSAPRDTPEFSQPTTLPAGTEATMAALDLDRAAVRDLQARLLVAGHDPNGIDGLIGPGTRGALQAWQVSQGVAANGLLNDPQLELVKRQTDEGLASWLEDPQNAALHTPPPPIAIGPGNLSGTWRFTTTCGPNSKLGQSRITGVVSLQHAGGNRYTGILRNSQGLRGQYSALLNGRQYTAEVNFGFLIGKVQVTGRIADRSLTVRGRDSNGCSFYSTKA